MIGSIIIAWVFLGGMAGFITGLYCVDKKHYSHEAGVAVGVICFLLAPIMVPAWIGTLLWNAFKVVRAGVRDLRAMWFPKKTELPKARVIK